MENVEHYHYLWNNLELSEYDKMLKTAEHLAVFDFLKMLCEKNMIFSDDRIMLMVLFFSISVFFLVASLITSLLFTFLPCVRYTII